MRNYVSQGEKHVTLKHVTEEIKENKLSKNNEYLCDLLSFLQNEIEQDWYKNLNKLRNEMSHVKFDHFVRTSLHTPDRQLIDLKFLLPQGVAENLKTEEERDIIYYCRDTIDKVEKVLERSFQVLSDYLSDR